MGTNLSTGIAKGESAADKAVDEAIENLDEEPDFAVVYVSPENDYEQSVSAVNERLDDAKVIGSSSAGEFTGEDVMEGSVAVGLISSDDMKFYTSMAEGISDDVMGTVEQAAEDLPKEVEEYPHMAGINLHEGLAGVGESVALAAKTQFGNDVPFAGGSAGDDGQLEETYVFEGEKVRQDAVVLGIIASKKPVELSVEHGHEPVSGEYEVTEAEGSVVKELDGRPAFEVWKDEVREHAKEDYGIDVDEISPEDDEFGKLLTAYELGIETDEDNYKIRWPGPTNSEEEGDLTFAVNIPEGVQMKVMRGETKSQIDSAEEAARSAVEKSEGDIAGALVFDCVCRAMILGDIFDEAVEAMENQIENPLVGFETYGEVCMREGEMSGYHNTTSVVMVLPD